MPVKRLIERYPALLPQRPQISKAGQILVSAFQKRKKLLLCGNGGSASDCDHISGELLKSFTIKRPLSPVIQKKLKTLFPEEGAALGKKLEGGLPAIPLPGLTAFISAFSNDADPSLVFAQGVTAVGHKGDVLLALSTSGRSKNVVAAVMAARAMGLKTIGLTGHSGGRLKDLCDVTIRVPAHKTPDIQEFHLPVYHALCIVVEKAMSKNRRRSKSVRGPDPLTQ